MKSIVKNKSRISFTKKIIENCEKKGVKVFLYLQEVIDGEYLGYFDSDKKELSVAALHKESFEVLLHEYCHFLQWCDGINMVSDRLEDYLAGNLELNDTDLSNEIFFSLLLEISCERRTLEIILNNPDFKIDVKKHIKSVNSLLYGYGHIMIDKVWKQPREKKDKKRFLELMPDDKIIDIDMALSAPKKVTDFLKWL